MKLKYILFILRWIVIIFQSWLVTVFYSDETVVKFFASQVAVFLSVPRSKDKIEPMIPGRAAAALPSYSCQPNYPGQAKGSAGDFYPLFQIALFGWLGSRRQRTFPTTSECKHKGRDRQTDCRENRCNGNFLLTRVRMR